MIHMNGRVYEPTLGRFMSADPIIQEPEFSQSFNRYSYVMNNPLSLTDPSGYFGVPQLEVEIVIGHREAPAGSNTSSSLEVETVVGTKFGNGDGGSGGGSGGASAGTTGDYGPWSKPYPDNGLSTWENMALRYNQFMRGEFYPLLPMGTPISPAEARAQGIITPPWIFQGGHYVGEGNPYPEYVARQGMIAAQAEHERLKNSLIRVADRPASIILAANDSNEKKPILIRGGGSQTVTVGKFKALDFPGALLAGAKKELKPQNLIFRQGNANAYQFTPRTKDVKGLSAFDSLENAKPGNNQIIDTSLLKNLCAVCDNPETGHISIFPKDFSQMQGWMRSKGGTEIHPLTQELLDANVGKVKK